MTKKKYDMAIYIGRFQPFHKGHLHALREAAKIATNVVILVGSSNQPATPKNPWSFSQRVNMIMDSLPDEVKYDDSGYSFRCFLRPLNDYRYDDTLWATEVQRIVNEVAHHCKPNNMPEGPKSFVLIGHDKDESSYYLKMFPQWPVHDTGITDMLDATRVRDLLFSGEVAFLESVVSDGCLRQLKMWQKTPEYAQLKKEHEYNKKYKSMWPAKIYVTTDVVCVQSGHVLMIERGRDVGVGSLALPGGFLEENERIEDGAIRELQEETAIKLQEKILRRSIVATQAFDSPSRDLRARIITHAHLIKLDDTQELPKVHGSDDARKAWWYPIADLEANRHRIYGDHYDIILSMLGKLKG